MFSVANPSHIIHYLGLGQHKIRVNSNNGGQILLHSLSTNDASLGEYKYTVNVGQHSIKVTGDCFELVRVSTICQ